MRYNDCMDCNQPIGQFENRCSSCTEKFIQKLEQESKQAIEMKKSLTEFISLLEFSTGSDLSRLWTILQLNKILRGET